MQNHKENKCKPDVCLHVDLFCVRLLVWMSGKHCHLKASWGTTLCSLHCRNYSTR